MPIVGIRVFFATSDSGLPGKHDHRTRLDLEASLIRRPASLLILGLIAIAPAHAQTMRLATTSSDYQVTNVFSDVDFFNIRIDIDAPLAPGVYVDPAITSVVYRVTGVLAPGTPSGFPAFDPIQSVTEPDYGCSYSLRALGLSPAAYARIPNRPFLREQFWIRRLPEAVP